MGLSLANMCQVALIGYAIGGAFLSLAYFDLPYSIVVVLVAINRWVDAKSWVVSDEQFDPGATVKTAA